MLRKAARFVKEILMSAMRYIRDWMKGIFTHTEAIVLLVLAGIGISALIGELPFLVGMPMWIESQMVIPAIATFIVTALVLISSKRSQHRLAHA